MAWSIGRLSDGSNDSRLKSLYTSITKGYSDSKSFILTYDIWDSLCSMEAVRTLTKLESSEEGFDCKYRVKIVFTITASIVEQTN